MMKKIGSLLLALSLCLSLAACGDRGGEKRSEGAGAGLASGMMWVTKTREVYPLAPGCTVTGAARLGDSLLISGEFGDAAPVLALAGYTVESDGSVSLGDAVPLSLDEPDAVDEGYLYGVCAGGDGSFYVLTGERPAAYTGSDGARVENEDYAGRYSILKYSDGGEWTGRMKITGWHADSAAGIAVGPGGEIVLYGDSYLSLLRWNGDVIRTEELGSERTVQSVSCDGEGLVASLFEYGAVQGEFYRIDGAGGTLTPLTAVCPGDATALREGNWAVSQGLSGEYIADDRGSFYAVDFEGETAQELLAWNSTRNSVECTCVCRLAENAFAYVVPGRESLRLASRAEQEYKDRSVVKVALYEISSEATLVDALNAAEGGKYLYECERYAVEDLPRLRAELSSQNAPDLVLFNGSQSAGGGGQNFSTDSEYFEDLYPYLDADPELSRGSFLPNLLQSLEVNGQLHELWSYVSVYTVAARAADVGDAKGLTPADHQRMMEENRAYRYLLHPAVLGTQEELLNSVAVICSSAYVDRNTRSCHFDNEQFAALLAWVKDAGAAEEDALFTPDMSEVMLFPEWISTPLRVRYCRENFGEPIAFVGFPTGVGANSFYANNGICMAIPTRSGNSDGAWEYIRSALSMEEQCRTMEDDWAKLPVHAQAFQRVAQSCLEKEDAALLFGLLGHTTAAQRDTDAPLQEIIVSAGLAYLAGDKSLEETVAQIQSRAAMYMAEKYS